MANDVVLGAAMRSNLLSLQNTQRSIDSTQLRLATGKKINSALDGPQSFFTAQSLNNRASDLTRLLDGIGQSIRTIEEADKGVTALTKMVEQAQSIVSSARDELAASDGSARLVGNVNLSSYNDLTGAPFAAAGIANGDTFSIATIGDNGLRISNTITIATGDTAYSLAAKITDAFADTNAGEIKASVTAQGYLSIESKDGRSFKLQEGVAGGITVAGFQALGFQGIQVETRTAGAFASTTVVAGNTAKSISLYESAGNFLDAGDTIVSATPVINAAGNTVVSGLVAGDTFTFSINNTTTVTTPAITATTTWQDLVDTVNGDTTLNTLISASFDAKTGQFSITSKSDTVRDVQFAITPSTATARTFSLGLGDPTGILDPLTPAAASIQETVLKFNSSTSALDGFTKDYNNIRSQINDLVKDAQYRGVNLLAGDKLTTFFNEDNSSRLVTEGSNFTADGLGLAEVNFTSLQSIEAADLQSKTALEAVRAFGSSLANNLSIIQTRRDFTEQTINTLKAGAADLTDADLNEEGANLLALQTAQQLGVTSLSLASQSQQSVLRLF